MSEAGTEAGKKILAAAIAFLPKSEGGTFGPVPYGWGHATHASTDCSGLTLQCVDAGTGHSIPHNAELQWQQHLGGRVPTGQALEGGDLVFFAGSDGTPVRPGHCGIVESFDAETGQGVMIDAPYTGEDVRRDAFSIRTHTGVLAFTGATRPRNVVV